MLWSLRNPRPLFASLSFTSVMSADTSRMTWPCSFRWTGPLARTPFTASECAVVRIPFHTAWNAPLFSISAVRVPARSLAPEATMPACDLRGSGSFLISFSMRVVRSYFSNRTLMACWLTALSTAAFLASGATVSTNRAVSRAVSCTQAARTAPATVSETSTIKKPVKNVCRKPAPLLFSELMAVTCPIASTRIGLSTEAGDALADEDGGKDQEQHCHHRRVMSSQPRLPSAENLHRASLHREVDDQRESHTDRCNDYEDDERADLLRDRYPRLRDRRDGRYDKEEVLGIGPGEDRPEAQRLRPGELVKRLHPLRHLGLFALLRPLSPPPGSRKEEYDSEQDLERVCSLRRLAAGDADGVGNDENDGSRDCRSGKPAEQERRTVRRATRSAQHQDHRDDRNRTYADPHRQWQNITDDFSHVSPLALRYSTPYPRQLCPHLLQFRK